MSEKIDVRIDRDECIMCGVCWSVCPEFYEESDEDGLSQVVEEYRVGDDLSHGKASQDLEDCVEEGADGCPVAIIHVEE
jgi:ferredoxin